MNVETKGTEWGGDLLEVQSMVLQRLTSPVSHLLAQYLSLLLEKGKGPTICRLSPRYWAPSWVLIQPPHVQSTPEGRAGVPGPFPFQATTLPIQACWEGIWNYQVVIAQREGHVAQNRVK